MKRIIFTLALILAAGTIAAQDETPAYKRNYLNDKSETVESARNALGTTADRLQLSGSGEDLVKVKGAYYMPLYTVNLYKGSDGEGFRSECRRLFAERYPKAQITSVVLPQTAWLTEEAVKNGKTVGYTQTMYCYVIASDGSENHINARFAYKRYKDEGGKYSMLTGYSPKLERTDMLTAEVYKKLLKK